MQTDLPQEDDELACLRSADMVRWPADASWKPAIAAFASSDQGKALAAYLKARIDAGTRVFPPHPFRALELTPLERVRMVIVGQDPYHGAGQAEGLAFSVAPGKRLPPSLRNIFRELHGAESVDLPTNGSLAHWARQGVLLLNTCLTVEEGNAGSHAKRGWEALTDALLAEVAAHASPCVYLLWGGHAQAKAGMIERTAREQGCRALVLQSNHPSPLSASRPPVPFLGSGHFARAREWLAKHGHRVKL